MRKITEWKPDTCSCVIQYEWDTDDSSVDNTVSTIPCEAHLGAGEDNAVRQAVLKENRLKNNTVNDILSKVPRLSPAEVSFNFDAERVLHINVALEQSEVDSVSNAIPSGVILNG